MEGMNCDEEGGWKKVAYLNMTSTEPGTTCPSGLTQTRYINITHDVVDNLILHQEIVTQPSFPPIV